MKTPAQKIRDLNKKVSESPLEFTLSAEEIRELNRETPTPSRSPRGSSAFQRSVRLDV